MRIYDGFMFHNEWDILDIRMRELEGLVTKHVVVMGEQTFQGTPVEDIDEKEERLIDTYGDRVVVFRQNFTSAAKTSWDKERLQRNAIGRQFKKIAAPNDFVMVSDVDEIPRGSVVNEYAFRYEYVQPIAFDLRVFYVYLNVGTTEYTHTVKGTRMQHFTRAQDVRQAEPSHLIPNAGWHFSYLGDEEFIQKKLKSFAHSEFNRPQYTNLDAIRDKMDRMVSPWDGSEKYERFEIDDTWPRAVLEDRERWNKYVLD